MSKLKEFLTILYGIIGMVIFFAFIFFGGNRILSLVGLYYKYVFYVGLPLVGIYWVLSRFNKKG